MRQSASSVPRVIKALAVGAVLAVLMSPMAASASMYVMIADEDLVDMAPVIVHGTVLDVNVVEMRGAVFTEYVLAIIDPIRGDVGKTVTVRQMGGMTAEGNGAKIFGLPEYRAGDGAVMFLEPWKQGSYRAVDPMLASFRTASVAGATYAQRTIEVDQEVTMDRPEPRASLAFAHQPRQLGAWLDWMRDRVDGLEREPDYYADPAEIPAGVFENFSIFIGSNGLPFRWPNFDNGGNVKWVVHKKKLQKGMPSKGVNQARAGLEAWNKVGSINYVLTGKSNAGQGWVGRDGKNAVVYNDPKGDIAGKFNCSSGGTLAIGGVKSTGAHFKDGKQYNTVVEGDVIFQDGLKCFFQRVARTARGASSAATQINKHEGGHTLACGHSKKSKALMAPTFKDNGSSGKITGDDKKCMTKGMRYR